MKLSWVDYPEKYDDDSLLKAADFCPELSGDFLNRGEGHLLIKGDNYPVLKKLSSVCKNITVETAGPALADLIYIDPPYNTGNDFTYNDDFSVRLKETNERSVVDKHSAWLSFMQRRLLAALPLLKESGCIFIAIDQSELYALKLLCDQIFGEENFVNDFMWLHGKGKKDRWSRTLQQHTLCYARNKKKLRAFRELEQTSWATRNADNDPRGNWFSGSISFSEKRSNPKHKNYYSVTSPSGKVWTRQWQTDENHMKELIADKRIFWGNPPLYDKVPRLKIFNEEETEVIPRNIIEPLETTRSAQQHLDSLLGEKGAFDNPKPVSLIKHLIKITCLPADALIMDFFAGSGTSLEAVCELNAEDKGHRRCILVQKDENKIFDLCKKRCQKICLKYGEKLTFSSLNDL